MSQIVHLVLERLVESLTLRMRTQISSSDPTQADIIKMGRFQDDPLGQNVHLWISGGNPEDPSDKDARVGASGMEDLDLNIPSGEVGGGHLWWRKGRVEIGCYFIQEKFTQEVASDYAHKVLGRAMHWIERTEVSDLVDDFGERASMIAVYASTFFEGGGPPDQYIWRGSILWQCLTERPY